MTLPPLLFALLMWFIGTAAVVWLDSRPRETFRTSLTLAGLVAIGCDGAGLEPCGDSTTSAAPTSASPRRS